jgi:hypothetical protein
LVYFYRFGMLYQEKSGNPVWQLQQYLIHRPYVQYLDNTRTKEEFMKVMDSG